MLNQILINFFFHLWQPKKPSFVLDLQTMAQAERIFSSVLDPQLDKRLNEMEWSINAFFHQEKSTSEKRDSKRRRHKRRGTSSDSSPLTSSKRSRRNFKSSGHEEQRRRSKRSEPMKRKQNEGSSKLYSRSSEK